MYMKLKDGKSKVLTLSYDDCVVQDIRLMQIMDKFGIKGTFNINTGLYFPEDGVRERFHGRLKMSEAKELYTNSGHEIGVHGLKHLFMNQLKSDEVLTEVLDDRRNIESQYGVLARGMAYPFGVYNDEVIDILKKCGICYCRTINKTEKFSFPVNWLTWHPTCHHREPRLMELAERFVTSDPARPNENWMFYLWGHSYEFDNNDNWDVIEKFCEYTGGKEDIWYATNIEVYDYVMAYNALQVSVDRTIVHNPSAIPVWFVENKIVYCVEAGQTLLL